MTRCSLLLGALLALNGCQKDVATADEADMQTEMASISATNLFQEGVAHAQRSDMLRAEQYLNAAKDRGYEEGEVVSWLVRVCIASNRYNSALAHAEPYLKRNPADWPLRFVVANIYDALGETERAQRQLEQVVAHAPEEALPQYRLAVFYRERLADEAKAKAHFEKYLELDPSGLHANEVRALMEGETSAGPELIPYPKTIDVIDEDES